MTESRPLILRRILLRSDHRPTGRTHHYHGAEELSAPTMLQVAKYADDEGYYLFYCDESGEEFTDTYHDTLEAALAQAEWEFGVNPSEWESFGS